MQVRGLTGPRISDISFDLHKGEILGFCGLVGSGRTEVARAIFGADPRIAGTVDIDGVPLNDPTPKRAIKAGLGFVTEERKADGLALDADVTDNAGLASLKAASRGDLFSTAAPSGGSCFEQLQELDLRPLDLSFIVRRMSGGNQQKVILGQMAADEGAEGPDPR